MKTQSSGWEVAEVIGCTLAVIAGCIVAKLFGYWATASLGSWILGLVGVHSIAGVTGFKALFVLAVVADIAGAPFRKIKNKE